MRSLFLSFTLVILSPAISMAASVVIVFDDSGSMEGQYIEDAREATKQLIDQAVLAQDILELNTISVVPLNVGGYKAEIGNPASINDIKKYVNGIAATGSTPLAETIHKAVRENNDDRLFVFAFTDGDVNLQDLGQRVGRSLNKSKNDLIDLRFIKIGSFQGVRGNNQGVYLENLEKTVNARKDLGRSFKAYALKDTSSLAKMLEDLGQETISQELARKIRKVLQGKAQLQSMMTVVQWDAAEMDDSEAKLNQAQAAYDEVIKLRDELKEFKKRSDANKLPKDYVNILRQLMDNRTNLARMNDIVNSKYTLARAYDSYERSSQSAKELYDNSLSLMGYVQALKTEKPEEYNKLSAQTKAEVQSVEELFDKAAELNTVVEEARAAMAGRIADITELQNKINKTLNMIARLPSQIEKSAVDPRVRRALQEARAKAGVYTKDGHIVMSGTHLYVCEDDMQGEIKDLADNPNVAKHIVRCDGKSFASRQTDVSVVNEGTIIDLTGGKANSGGDAAGSFTNNGEIIKAGVGRNNRGEKVFTLFKNNGEVIQLEEVWRHLASGYYWAEVDKDLYAIFDKDMKNVYILSRAEIEIIATSSGFSEKAKAAGSLLAGGAVSILSTAVGSAVTLVNSIFIHQDKSIEENREVLDKIVAYNMEWLTNSWEEFNAPAGDVNVPKAILPAIEDIYETTR